MDVKTYQTVVEYTRRWIDYMHSISVTIDPLAERGLGFPSTKEIVLPAWLDNYDPIYQLYYLLHEMTHCMVGIKHTQVFMRVEDVVLSMWDIKIVRKRVYPRAVFWKDKEIQNIPSKRGRNAKR